MARPAHWVGEHDGLDASAVESLPDCGARGADCRYRVSAVPRARGTRGDGRADASVLRHGRREAYRTHIRERRDECDPERRVGRRALIRRRRDAARCTRGTFGHWRRVEDWIRPAAVQGVPACTATRRGDCGTFTRRHPLGCVIVDRATATDADRKKGVRMRTMRLALLIAVAVTVMAHAATRKVDFAEGAVGQPPKGFEFGHTAGVGSPGQWVIQA